ncbi:hypothetical protein F4860DRAFT_476881 [Xylaria cubensis]|nr:hypothetical protein F4860DRAFT_476881 [Xylaria cubensis]
MSSRGTECENIWCRNSTRNNCTSRGLCLRLCSAERENSRCRYSTCSSYTSRRLCMGIRGAERKSSRCRDSVCSSGIVTIVLAAGSVWVSVAPNAKTGPEYSSSCLMCCSFNSVSDADPPIKDNPCSSGGPGGVGGAAKEKVGTIGPEKLKVGFIATPAVGAIDKAEGDVAANVNKLAAGVFELCGTSVSVGADDSSISSSGTGDAELLLIVMKDTFGNG